MKSLGILARAGAACVLLLAACSLPETRVSTGASRPTLIVTGAPSGAMLYVDGLSMGPADKYDGRPGVLPVEEGTHQVEVRSGSTVIHSEKAFVTSGTSHAVNVSSGGK